MSIVGDFAADHIEFGDIDGVPFVRTDGLGDPWVKLMFRVGTADEALPQRGMTHLVEHLALKRFENETFPFNGSTGITLTSFVCLGGKSTASRFLNGVLGELVGPFSVGVVEHEAGILRAEAASRSESIAELLVRRRFGSTPFGRGTFPEYWLEAPAAESLGGWARQSFTRANACLVVHGPALPDVDFSVLSQGQFLETPTLTDGRRGTRFFERRQGPVIGLADIPRSTAAATAVGYLQLRLVDRIRGQAGLSYAPFASYSAITGNHALVTYGADAAGQHESVVAQTVLSVLESLIDGGPSEDEQERMAGMLAHAEEMSHGRRAVFEAAGEALAFRCEAIAGDELRRRREAATSQDIQEALLEIRDRSLYSMPQQVELTSPQPVLYRGLSDVVLDGSRHRAVDGGSTLVALERRGMSYIEPNLALTITIDTAQAVLTYGDGTVLLLDDRGAAIILRPRMWRDLPRLRQVALSLVGPNDVIPNGFRYDIPYFTGQGPDRVFDVASHQLQDSRWDDTLPRSRIFVLGGVLLSWLADRELLADWVEVEGRAWLDRYRSGDLGAADLYAHLGGILASDMVNSAGNEVLNRLYFTSGSPKQTALLDKVWSEITPRGSCWIADEPALVDAAHERINTHALPSKVFRRAAPFPVTRRPTARVSSTPSPVGPTPPPPMEVTRHR